MLVIATNSYIYLTRVKMGMEISDIQNIDVRINTDGEQIHQMVIYKECLYYGGSSG